MLEDPHFWVAVAFVLFVLLAYKKVSSMLITSLDARRERIRFELEEAQRLRQEAEAILADYKQKQAQSLKEAEQIIADARRDAESMTRHAENELKASLDARMKNALERIAQEETRAVEDVRNHVTDLALTAARTLVAEQARQSQDELVKQALSDIERKVH